MNRKTILQEIAARLKNLREQLKYSRGEMAAHFGITKNGYERNERGETLPGIDTLNRLSKNFDISMDWFLFNKGPMYYKEKEHKEEKPAEKNASETLLALQEVVPDVKELLDYMGLDPLLRYEVLVHFYKYKREQENKK